jgi:Rrf2 family protein
MIAAPKKLLYALEAVLYIAYNASAHPISSKEIAEKQGLPPRYLEHIMQRLVRAGILKGVRGPRGGYLIARERRKITLGEISRVLADEEDAEQQNLTFTELGEEMVRPVWNGIQAKVMEQLNSITLAELCDSASARNIRKHAEDEAFYAI